MDDSAFIPGTQPPDDGIVGVSDGISLVGTDTRFTGNGGSAAHLGRYTSSSAPDSIGEPKMAGVMPPTTIHFQDISGTGAGQYFIF